MTSRLPGGVREPDADGRTTLPTAGLWPGRCLIAVMLVAAAALDLARCGIVVATARDAGPTIGLVAAGLAAAALSLRTARGCRNGRRWSAWAALLIGAASAPQAAASGFHPPYTIPDIATAALGVLLTVAVLATAGPTSQPEQRTDPHQPPVSTASRTHRPGGGASRRRRSRLLRRPGPTIRTEAARASNTHATGARPPSEPGIDTEGGRAR